MADFCKQCSLREFDEDFRDLAGIARTGYGARVICEGCSPNIGYEVWVNENGECMTPNCLYRHGSQD